MRLCGPAALMREENTLENRDYEKILNAMPETGVYVIREDDHGLLYFNRRVQQISPEVRLGMTCHKVWTGSCVNCPLLTIKGRDESRSLSYNALFGGVVDMTATRILWEDSIPAFVVTVTPRIEATSYAYQIILRVNLGQNKYDVLKSDGSIWLSEAGADDFSAELAHFTASGAIHPDDLKRFTAFTSPEHLRDALHSGKTMLTCTYRRQQDGEFRWALIEVVRGFDYSYENQIVMFCVKDVHDTMGAGLEWEESTSRNQDIIRTIGEHSFTIYTIDLETGSVSAVRVDGHTPDEHLSLPPAWDELLYSQIIDRIHTAYRESFQQKFSLEALRRATEDNNAQSELLCQWKCGDTYRYISVTAYPGRESGAKRHTVLAMQDMDEKIRRELSHSQRDMQMAAIFKSRFNVMSTVQLDNGQCERILLNDTSEQANTHISDYNYHMQQALYDYVLPEDIPVYNSLLSLEHLREKAATVENYAEEICQYRTKGEPVRWLEQHIIYTRQGDHVVVNILGHDITKEKSLEHVQLQTLQDRAYIISSLSSMFFSTYYMNLENDTFRTVTQLGKIGDVLGSEVNCTAAFQVYAKNFIHPDDQEEYLRIMNVHYLRQTLRWWQPNVSVYYRKVPDNPKSSSDTCRWVRATAILAQVGNDDMPRTVVYVAQDITESREIQSQSTTLSDR